MGHSVVFGSGTTPMRHDTRLMLLLKRLKALQAIGGSLAANNPTTADTIRTTRAKIDCSIKGISSKGHI